jgi:hypothetical protein
MKQTDETKGKSMTTKKKPTKKAHHRAPRKESPALPHAIDLSDGHHMGKYTGYDVRDGAIFPAPDLCNLVNAIHTKRRGLDNFVEASHSFVVKQYEILAKELRQWWERAEEDLGLPLRGEDGDVWTFWPSENCLRKEQKAEPPPERRGS